MDSLVVVVRVPHSENQEAMRGAVSEDGSGSQSDVVTAQGLTSSADESAGDGADEPSAAATARSLGKRRRSTYTARKEETDALKQKAAKLQETIEQLLAEKRRREGESLTSVGLNTAMLEYIAHNRETIASTQSLIASYNENGPILSNYIHLPVDQLLRQRILNELKPQKMKEALAFFTARCKYLDLRRSSRVVESYEAENGDMVHTLWEVVKIRHDESSVREVYDEMLEFARTSEMTIADKLGLVSVRESDVDSDEMDATQIRILATCQHKFLVEKNSVVFSQFFPHSEFLDHPHGLLLFDNVDQDDAFPYQPEQRIRKDESSAAVVVPCPSSTTNPEEPRAVVLVRWTYTRLHHSALASQEELAKITSYGVPTYADVMVQTIRERLAWRS